MATNNTIQSIIDFERILKPKIPQKAFEYCKILFEDNSFRVKIASDRISKSGDYRYHKIHRKHYISINDNLNIYAFLLTYIHEVAHLLTYLEFGHKVRAHGSEWKQTFRELMLPILNPSVFPDNILTVLVRHLRKPKASTHSDPALVKVLRMYDSPGEHSISELNDLVPGKIFEYNRKRFRKIKKRRTRIICQELVSSKNYLIPGISLVKTHVSEF